ncbi:MAG: hypothetical protein COV45_01495 [Deltaproteobacteria bacterium CG11_big_fil_rev_8_21_14_0_20_47_16]|nr:MAG: hypothetical protein COV45_01495 [Deltaproteobacteria bacterium CG11_big_fil_rev_8_21_14_0_20_47_16]
MRFCSLWHWHHQAKRGEGIEQQFTQVAVAAIYGFLVTNLAALSHILAFLIYPIAVVLASVSAINATLLYLWYKDPSRVPVNFYSHRKFINEDT